MPVLSSVFLSDQCPWRELELNNPFQPKPCHNSHYNCFSREFFPHSSPLPTFVWARFMSLGIRSFLEGGLFSRWSVLKRFHVLPAAVSRVWQGWPSTLGSVWALFVGFFTLFLSVLGKNLISACSFQIPNPCSSPDQIIQHCLNLFWVSDV